MEEVVCVPVGLGDVVVEPEGLGVVVVVTDRVAVDVSEIDADEPTLRDCVALVLGEGDTDCVGSNA